MIKRTCVDCGKQFEISSNEEQFFKSKGYDLPKRCKACRDKKSGKSLVKVTVNRPVFLKISLIFVIIAVVLVASSIMLFDNNAVLLLSGIAGLLLSLLFLLNSKTKKQVDLSFNSKYTYGFYDGRNLFNHYQKHGRELKCHNAEDYLKRANAVINNKKAEHKLTTDNDTAYFIAQTGEFVVVSPANYIRTYYITTYKYYLKQ